MKKDNSFFLVLLKKRDLLFASWKIDNPKWYDVHHLETKLLKEEVIDLPTNNSSGEQLETGPYLKILNIIAMLDQGRGVDIQDIISSTKFEKTESLVQNLIEEGEVFELSPGRVKLLK